MESVRHTINLEDKSSLLESQRKNWQYFIDKNASYNREDQNFNIDDKLDLSSVIREQIGIFWKI